MTSPKASTQEVVLSEKLDNAVSQTILDIDKDALKLSQCETEANTIFNEGFSSMFWC